MVGLAKVLKEEKRADPLIVTPDKLLADTERACQEHSLAWWALPPAPDHANSLVSLVERISRKIGGWRGGHPFARKRAASELEQQLSAAFQVLRDERADRLILYQGRNRSWEVPFVKAAGALGVPRVVLGLAKPALAADLVPRKKTKSHMGKHFPRLVAALPGQYAEHPTSGEMVSLYPAEYLEAAARLEALPPNPWVPGGNSCEIVMVSGLDEFRELVACGAEPDRLFLTGSQAHDPLFRGWQNRDELIRSLQERYRLPAGKPIVVLSMPQYGEHAQLPWEDHWKEVHHLCRVLTNCSASGLVSLHPRMDPASYSFISETYGLALASEPLVQVLPGADVFLASLSSTLSWAVLCRIPTLAMNFHGLPQQGFLRLPGVKLLTQRESLGPELERFLLDQGLRERISQRQAREAGRFSPYDGQCTERVLSAIVG
jgi:hypothetical protein